MYNIPGQARCHPIQSFNVAHLQQQGLDNTGNICAHISLLLCMHRMQLVQYLDHSRIVINGNVLHWPALVLNKILLAMPSSTSFCPHNFLTSWNSDGLTPALVGYDDLMIADNVLSKVPFTFSSSNIPLFTKFLLRYTCPGCGIAVEKEVWNEKTFAVVPMLPLPADGSQVSVEACLNTFIQTPQASFCTQPGCNGTRVMGRLVPKQGKFTVVLMNRYPSHRTRLRNPLVHTPGPLLGELVSIASRRGTLRRGHFVSYHSINNEWFCNDDSTTIFRPQDHPLRTPATLSNDWETADLLCFQNF